MSGHCYVVPFLGGVCGECNMDSDCPDGGCSAPNPFGGTPPMCNTGELGGGCEGDEVCQPGLVCGQVLNIAGIITIYTCGECRMDIDCAGGELCAPNVTVSQFKGQRECIAPETMPLDAFCELGGPGDQACMSGICSTVDLMGIDMIGACGECNTDADCQGGTCMAGSFDVNNGVLQGSRCA